MAVFGKLAHAWNAFLNQGPTDPIRALGFGATYSSRPDRIRLNSSNERSIISSVYTRLSMDVASTDIRHCRLDDNDRYLEELKSGLNECLTVEANIDQAASAFRQDIATTLFDKGVAAIVPVDTTLNPEDSASFEIKTMRVGEVLEWMPRKVRVSLYNESTGRREDLVLDKKYVAIVYNPLYDIMNEPNSTLQRLVRKLNLLDAVDEQSSSGKLDIIIQLPYAVKSETRKQQAEQRRQDMEFQLKDSKYGIAYTDATEKITQLNRPTENNLLKQVEYLTELLYNQLGLTKAIMDGTATEEAMLNYHYRTIEPVVRAIVESMRRSFLTKTARSQKQSILYFRDPFKLVPISQIADIADKFSRNEILAPNEIRGIIGFRPSKEPKSDMLINSNMAPTTEIAPTTTAEVIEGSVVEDDPALSALDSLGASLDSILSDLGGGDGGT